MSFVTSEAYFVFIFYTLAFQSRFCKTRRKDKNLNQASTSHLAFKNALCRQSGLGGIRLRERGWMRKAAITNRMFNKKIKRAHTDTHTTGVWSQSKNDTSLYTKWWYMYKELIEWFISASCAECKRARSHRKWLRMVYTGIMAYFYIPAPFNRITFLLEQCELQSERPPR